MSDCPQPCHTCGRWWNNLCSDAFHMKAFDLRNLRDAADALAAAQKRIEELEREVEYRRNVARDGDTLLRERAERIDELEAQVARHPEQLRRVAEGVWYFATNPGTVVTIRELPGALDAIIAEALK